MPTDNSHSNRPSPVNSPIIHSRLGNSRVAPITQKVEKHKKSSKQKRKNKKKMCHCRPKLAILSSTRSFFDLRKWVFHYGKDRHTDRHGDSLTDLAQKAESEIFFYFFFIGSVSRLKPFFLYSALHKNIIVFPMK